MSMPQGQHGFALPGEMTDWAVGLCREQQGASPPECLPEAIAGQTYDVGWGMFHMFGEWATGDRQVDPRDWTRCWSKDACGNLLPTPERRAASTLP